MPFVKEAFDRFDLQNCKPMAIKSFASAVKFAVHWVDSMEFLKPVMFAYIMME